MDFRKLFEKGYASLFLIFILALAFRLFGINQQSFFLDEIANLIIATDSNSLGELLAYLKPHPYVPFNYILLFLTNKVFPLTTETARFVPAIWDVIGLIGCYLLSKKLFSREKIRQLFLLFLVCSHPMIYFAQTFSPYSMMMALSVWGAWLLFEYQEKNKSLYLVLYFLIGVFMVGSHLLAPLIILAQGLGWLWSAKNEKRTLITWFALYLLLALSFLPWTGKALGLHGDVKSYSVSFLDPIFYYYRAFKSYPLAFLGGLVLLIGLWKKKILNDQKDTFLLCCILIPGFLLFVKSLVSVASFQFRYITMSLPFLFLLHFRVMDRLNLKAVMLPVLFIVGATLQLFTSGYYEKKSKMDYRHMAAKVEFFSERPLLCVDHDKVYPEFYMRAFKKKCDFWYNKNEFELPAELKGKEFLLVESSDYNSGLEQKTAEIKKLDVHRIKVRLLKSN